MVVTSAVAHATRPSARTVATVGLTQDRSVATSGREKMGLRGVSGSSDGSRVWRIFSVTERALSAVLSPHWATEKLVT